MVKVVPFSGRTEAEVLQLAACLEEHFPHSMANAVVREAKERGISKVRICCDHYNIASAKTIQSNGGVLEDEMFDSSDGMLTQRYWIKNR